VDRRKSAVDLLEHVSGGVSCEWLADDDSRVESQSRKQDDD
jgi:hypothetical protein